MDTLFTILTVLGALAFSISGAMTAVDKGLDLFGVVCLGLTTAYGGGILRDLFLGRMPPWVFCEPQYILYGLGASLLVFFVALVLQEKYIRREKRLEGVNNIFDAAGLGAFIVTGTQMAMDAGYADNTVFTLFIGLLTGIGGGLLRDVFTGSIPAVFRKRIYAVAALIGSGAYYYLVRGGASSAVASVVGMLTVFGVRMAATYFRWNMPTALKTDKKE